MINALKSSNALSFARQFILAPTSTGAISPASSRLAADMVDAAGVVHQQTVVELGPGTGVVTQVVAAKLAPGANFFALELNPVFADKTRQRCPGVQIYEENALNLVERLSANGLTHCDCILSSLPWTFFDKNLQQKLLSVIAAALKPGGTLVTYAYSGVRLNPAGRRFVGLMNDTFADVHCSNIIWQNVPPARIYTCRT